jgi:hypothetical protein
MKSKNKIKQSLTISNNNYNVTISFVKRTYPSKNAHGVNYKSGMSTKQ